MIMQIRRGIVSNRPTTPNTQQMILPVAVRTFQPKARANIKMSNARAKKNRGMRIAIPNAIKKLNILINSIL